MEPMPDPFRNDVAAYAAGALDPAERTALEQHLASGCVDCRGELAAHHRSLLGVAESLVDPTDPALRQQVLDLAGAPTWPVDLGSYSWDEVVAGVRIHVLREDADRGLRACLVWADPGAVHPPHRHLGDEVILVLQGGLGDERGEYGPGEICRSRVGSVHSERALPGEDCVCYVLYYGALEPVPA